MYKPIIFFIGLRYIRRPIADRFNKFISWLSTMGITIGVMSLTIVLSVMNGFENDLINNILKLIPQVIISSSITNSLNPQQFSKNTIKIQGVNHITPLTTSDVVVQSVNNVAVGVIIGIDPMEEDPLIPYLINVTQNDLKPGKYNIILGKQLAEQLKVSFGEQLRVIAPSANQFITPIGYLPSQRLFNIIGIFDTNSEVDSYQMLVNIHDASRLMHYPLGNITGWRLSLNEPLKIDQLNQKILPNNAKWQDWRNRKGDLFQAVRMEKNIMELLLSLIIIVSSFNIITSLGLMIMEKKREIAILQTQGIKPYQIMMIFMIQGVGIGVIGSFLGSVMGILFVSYFNSIMPVIEILFNNTMVQLPIKIELLQVIKISVISISVALISTLYPSWHAASINPALVLRYE